MLYVSWAAAKSETTEPSEGASSTTSNPIILFAAGID
jgi:hypothetical protein